MTIARLIIPPATRIQEALYEAWLQTRYRDGDYDRVEFEFNGWRVTISVDELTDIKPK